VRLGGQPPLTEPFEPLAALGRVRRFRKGAVLFGEGDRSDWVGYILKGSVKASTFGEDGRETVHNVLGRCDLLGDLAGIDGEPRSATVTALETVEVSVVPAQAFTEFLTAHPAHPAAAVELLRSVTRRLRAADRRRAEFGSMDVVSRLARLLLELRERYGHGDATIGISLTQEELAGWTGASREAVVKALRVLRERGLIETARRQIRILDPDALLHVSRK
jgi:CRP/FNR family transcriptional regulator, cyclic AMP receptor protein